MWEDMVKSIQVRGEMRGERLLRLTENARLERFMSTNTGVGIVGVLVQQEDWRFDGIFG